MTVFILHGGYTSTPVKRNREFYQEIIRRMSKHGKLLFIYFAQDEAKWPELLENDRQKFEGCGIKKGLKLEIAEFSERKLTEQISDADCVYIRGGRDSRLMEALRMIGNLKGLIEGKIVVGSSAGANVLSRYFYRNSKQQVEEGLGILPIKVFCHYDSNKKGKLKQLKAHGEELPVHTLPEADFIIMEKTK